MVNPLNIILPFLHSKRQQQEVCAARNISEEIGGLAAVLRNFSAVPPNGLEDKIYALSVQLSQATTLSLEGAVGYVTECIREKVNRGHSADAAVKSAFDEITAEYLSRPLGVFDKRHEVPREGGENR